MPVVVVFILSIPLSKLGIYVHLSKIKATQYTSCAIASAIAIVISTLFMIFHARDLKPSIVRNIRLNMTANKISM